MAGLCSYDLFDEINFEEWFTQCLVKELQNKSPKYVEESRGAVRKFLALLVLICQQVRNVCYNKSGYSRQACYKLKYNFVETKRKFIIAELSIRKLGSSSVLIITHELIISTDEDPSLRIESSAIINLRGVSTKLCFNLIFTIQTYMELVTSCQKVVPNTTFSVCNVKQCALFFSKPCWALARLCYISPKVQSSSQLRVRITINRNLIQSNAIITFQLPNYSSSCHLACRRMDKCEVFATVSTDVVRNYHQPPVGLWRPCGQYILTFDLSFDMNCWAKKYTDCIVHLFVRSVIHSFVQSSIRSFIYHMSFFSVSVGEIKCF